MSTLVIFICPDFKQDYLNWHFQNLILRYKLSAKLDLYQLNIDNMYLSKKIYLNISIAIGNIESLKITTNA